MPARRVRAATVSLLTAGLLVLGGSFVMSGSSHAMPVEVAQSAPVEAIARISTATTRHPVGVSHFEFSRGKDRPLPTTVWYPAAGTARRDSRLRSTVDATPALGRYPLIVWSHGFYSNPQEQQGVTEFFAANGFVVVAATYPYTKKDGPHFNKADVPNQALDASYVITKMLERGNPLAVHIDPNRMAAVGHSGGGTTTNVLFTKHRDPRLKAGIIISGRPAGTYSGTPVPLLFVHGDKDPVVAYSQGRGAYAADAWPKAFLTMVGTQHGAALGEPDRGHAQVMSTMLDFLRWTIDGDTNAKDRLAGDGTVAGVARFESVGIFGPADSPNPDSTNPDNTNPAGSAAAPSAGVNPAPGTSAAANPARVTSP